MFGETPTWKRRAALNVRDDIVYSLRKRKVQRIKKKKHDKVAAEKEKFKTGFGAKLMNEGASEEEASSVVEQIWTIIENAASYMFCCAHAYAMACDSLYGAWLKAHYPYEFYSTILRLYTEKGNKEKIALIIDEMKRYKGIGLVNGKLGEDNRDWYCDKENHTISQSLPSVKFMSPKAAEDLYEAGKQSFATFTDCLWYLLMKTCLNTRQVEILIRLGYFSCFGGSGKLLTIFREFYTGKNKLTKTIKSYEARLAANRELEASLSDEELPIFDRVKTENENVGLCFSNDPTKIGYYLVSGIDDKYGIKVQLYNIARGTESPPLKVKKDKFAKCQLKENDIVYLAVDDCKKKQRCIYKDGKRTVIPGEFDYWLENYTIA